jgi:hypothetical protein
MEGADSQRKDDIDGSWVCDTVDLDRQGSGGVKGEIDMKGLSVYGFAFLFVIAAAVFLGNFDTITPAVVEARSETSVGVTTMSVWNSGMVLIMKWILGATVAGLAGAAFVEGRKIYRMWWISKKTRRWTSGPNANYQQQPSQKIPKLTRDDLLYLALANQGRASRVGSRRVLRGNDQEVDNELEIDL